MVGVGAVAAIGGGATMFEQWGWLATIVLAVAGIAIWLTAWPRVRSARRLAHFADARRLFHLQRERLEAKFIQMAIAGAKPRAPHWNDCDFDDDVAYVRNRATGQLSAFVGVTVTFAATGDESPEHDFDRDDASADIGPRLGTAVFRFTHDRWETDGVLLLNLAPAEAVQFYSNELEIVAQELGAAGQ